MGGDGSMNTPAGWVVWQSDAGRWWATRTRPFPTAAEYAGAARTVDGTTRCEVCAAIAAQEAIAAQHRR